MSDAHGNTAHTLYHTGLINQHAVENHGTSASSVKDTMMSFMGNMAALAHTPAPDEVIKNTLANFAFEHFEIAAYKSLIALAEQIGDANGILLLTTSLREEEAMAAWIDKAIAPTTLKFAAMKAAA
jgi:ferritin-like metal-binding protein YciE